MNTVGAFPGGGSDDFRRKISELNPTIEVTVESRGRERAGADVGLVYITGHSGRFVVDPHSTHRATFGRYSRRPQSRLSNSCTGGSQPCAYLYIRSS